MAKTVKVPVTPNVLAWARRSACVTIEDAAKAASVDPKRIDDWENGVDAPSLAMLRKLAVKYKRPLAVLLLPEPPRDFAALRDFRRLVASEAAIPAKVASEIRIAYERREIALEMLRDTGDEPIPFDLKVHLDDDPEAAAKKFRRYFAVDQAQQLQWARRSVVFESWRSKIEAKGVLVFVMGGSHGPLVRQVRGFAIAAGTLPVVAVNGRDKTNGRTFTLLHECAHVALGQAVVENDTTRYSRLPAGDKKIERFCNAVAAATLMPREAVEGIASRQQKGPHSEWADHEINAAAEYLGVSREAFLLRAVELKFASARFYIAKRAQYAAEYAKMDEPSPVRTPIAPYKTVLGRYGRPYARSVLNSYQERRITMSDAAGYLDVDAKHIDYISRQAFKGV